MDDLERRLAVQSLPMVGWARMVLNFCGAVYLLLFLLMPVLFYMQMPPEMMEDPFGIGMFAGILLGTGCMGIVVVALNFAAARGLAAGKAWGWYIGLALGMLYLPSGCLPFGAVILIGLLGEKARNLYLKGELPA